MYARLNASYGWTWKYEDKSIGPFILQDIERYAGMLSGWTFDGRKCARPLSEFEALSLDGEDWHPTASLLALVPQESNRGVPVQDLPLPVAFDEDQS